MIVFPPCKINIGLHITGKRPDGYHDLESIFFPVPLTDALEVIETNGVPPGSHMFSSSGLNVPGDPESNLVIKALRLVQARYTLPSLAVHLHKVIPTGAGLGGGSSDGVMMLHLLNRKFLLGMSTAELMEHAVQLGSDCPFFVESTPAYVTGRGEHLESIELNLAGCWLLLIHPGIHISTAEAFGMIQPKTLSGLLKDYVRLPVEQWKGHIFNDFEQPLVERHPLVGQLRDSLYEAGAMYAAMSGSGSAVYGLFREEPELLPGSTGWFQQKVLL